MSRLDEIASSCALSATAGENPFSQALTMARSIQSLREELTDPIMEEVIMPLMNTKLGFRTDKDPNRPVWNPQTRTKVAPEAYGLAVVRECSIEAFLRGLPSIGNCWNIISGQTYVTKEGFWFLLGKRIGGLTDFKISVGVPKMIRPAGDARNASDEEAKGAVVPCSASWKMNGTPDHIEREIPIRVNAMMGADAIMGKAERKILAAAYAQITGTTLGDADATEMPAEPDMRHAGSSATTENRPPRSAPPEDMVEKAFSQAEQAAQQESMVDEFIPGQAIEEVREMLFDAEITPARFDGMLKKVKLISTTETFGPGLKVEKLRKIYDNAAAIIAGTYSAGGDQ